MTLTKRIAIAYYQSRYYRTNPPSQYRVNSIISRPNLNKRVKPESPGNLEDSEYTDIGSLFDCKNPKDIRQGLTTGIGNIVFGTFGGITLLLVSPVKAVKYGASTESRLGVIQGLALGIATGVLGCVGMTIAGIVAGGIQIGKGLYNTPVAIAASSAGKVWDEQKREWNTYNLPAEADEILTMTDEEYLKSINYNNGGIDEVKVLRKVTKYDNGLNVADTELYDILGISPSASTIEIKKAYYIQAKQSHPDLHQNDPKAKEKFQKIGLAYQILINGDQRAAYDKFGKAGISDDPEMDASTLFAMIFGSAKFESLVGELKLAHEMQLDEHELNNSKLMKFHQRKRVIQCALNLAKKLQLYIDGNGDDQAFKAAVDKEIDELTVSPFGGMIVTTIGNVYSDAAASASGTMRGVGISMRQLGRGINTKLGLAMEATQALYLSQQFTKEHIRSMQANSDLIDEDIENQMNKVGQHTIAAMWHISEMDIQVTVAAACNKVLLDNSVSESQRNMRCRALALLGERFTAKGSPSSVLQREISDLMGQ